MSVMYLPSGISVSQAKKDAKKLSKQEELKLSDALDRIAFQHGRGSWAEVSYQITSQNGLSVSLNTSVSNKKEITLSKGSSLTTLIGPSGCGKTVLALEFAAQWLGKGYPVVYLGFPGGQAELDEIRTHKKTIREGSTDQIFANLARRFPKRFRVVDFPWYAAHVPNAAPKEIKEEFDRKSKDLDEMRLSGAILIVDELYYYTAGNLDEIHRLVNSSMHSVITAQDYYEIKPLYEGLSQFTQNSETKILFSPSFFHFEEGYVGNLDEEGDSVYFALSALGRDNSKASRAFVLVQNSNGSENDDSKSVVTCHLKFSSHSAFSA